MRVWDFPPSKLCNKHLIAQHHEIHCIYNIITKGLKGFRNHPEVKRWEGHLISLWQEHQLTVIEMIYGRGTRHNSPMKLNVEQSPFKKKPAPWQPIEKQLEILKGKGCDCYKNIMGSG